jgi:hypothetical protein
MTRNSLSIVATAFVLGGCSLNNGLHGFDEQERYLQRADVVTLSAGDAMKVNAMTHMIHPWPKHAFNRSIPVHGERMAKAVKNYRRGVRGSAPGVSTGALTVNVEQEEEEKKD